MSKLALLCPLYTRVESLGRLAEELEQTVPGAELYLRCVKGVTPLFPITSNMVLRYSDTTRYAEGINELARMAVEDGCEWLGVMADDLKLHEGWWEEAMKVHAETGALVIGLQDCHNPRVIAGQHATHFLVHRTFLQVGSFDGPGTIMSTSYHHSFVDDELRTTALHYGIYAMAMESRVEHLHPVWGFGEWDETYERGAGTDMDKDEALFHERMRKFIGPPIEEKA